MRRSRSLRGWQTQVSRHLDEQLVRRRAALLLREKRAQGVAWLPGRAERVAAWLRSDGLEPVEVIDCGVEGGTVAGWHQPPVSQLPAVCGLLPGAGKQEILVAAFLDAADDAEVAGVVALASGIARSLARLCRAGWQTQRGVRFLFAPDVRALTALLWSRHVAAGRADFRG